MWPTIVQAVLSNVFQLVVNINRAAVIKSDTASVQSTVTPRISFVSDESKSNKEALNGEAKSEVDRVDGEVAVPRRCVVAERKVLVAARRV